MMLHERIVQLIGKHCFNLLSEPEKQELEAWKAESPSNRELLDRLYADFLARNTLLTAEASLRKFILNYGEYNPEPIIKRKSFLLLKIASLFLLVVMLPIFMSKSTQDYLPGIRPNASASEGYHTNNSVVIELANGRLISPDKIKDDTLIVQGDLWAWVSKTDIEYFIPRTASHQKYVLFNRISTPCRRQYTIKFPDGSSSTLNAVSSISIPVSQYKRNRTVTLTGEALFEIQTIHDGRNKVPFCVQVKTATGLAQEVVVTGTTFNINAYNDEPLVKTTLLEGSVVVKCEARTVALRPGEESQLGKAGIEIRKIPFMETTISWKNDSFVFVNKPIADALREVDRWYGISNNEAFPSDQLINYTGVRSANYSDVRNSIKFPDQNHK